MFAVTHNYTGYPLVRQAREMILGGELGEINAIRVVYIQGWLRHAAGARATRSRPRWRTDPAKSGAAGCFGDIGTHAYNLARYMTGLLPETDQLPSRRSSSRAASSTTTAQAVIRFENGALGTRDRLADQPRPRERPVHRDRRHQGLARVAAGRAEQDARPPQRPAARHLHPRPATPRT